MENNYQDGVCSRKRILRQLESATAMSCDRSWCYTNLALSVPTLLHSEVGISLKEELVKPATRSSQEVGFTQPLLVEYTLPKTLMTSAEILLP